MNAQPQTKTLSLGAGRWRSGLHEPRRASKNGLSGPGFPGTVCVLMKQVNLGIIGGGTVGSGVFLHLQRNGALMASRLGVKVNLVEGGGERLTKNRSGRWRFPVPT